jgi:hypothetical protein
MRKACTTAQHGQQAVSLYDAAVIALTRSKMCEIERKIASHLQGLDSLSLQHFRLSQRLELHQQGQLDLEDFT